MEMAGERDEEILKCHEICNLAFFLQKHLLNHLYSILYPVVWATVQTGHSAS